MHYFAAYIEHDIRHGFRIGRPHHGFSDVDSSSVFLEARVCEIDCVRPLVKYRPGCGLLTRECDLVSRRRDSLVDCMYID